MGRTRLTQARLAQALGISQPRVASLHAAGMPTTSVAAAQAWRSANLDQSLVAARRLARGSPAPAPTIVVDQSFSDAVALVLDDAAEDIVARLAVDMAMTIEDANVAVSVVALALSDALDRLGEDGDPVLFVTGPLSFKEGEERAAVRSKIEARVAAIEAELAAELAAECNDDTTRAP